ncbi:MAG: DUF4169 family protein [Beijerinckiaceae bacterium]
MSDIVNLNKFRKQKQRAARDVQAHENRVAFGRTKAEKNLAKARDAQAQSRLDGHRLTPPDAE